MYISLQRISVAGIELEGNDFEINGAEMIINRLITHAQYLKI